MRFELSKQDRIQRNEQFAREFFAEILDFDYDECLVTDESFITDFDITVIEAHSRIRARYGVDVSDLLGGPLVDVLEGILVRRPRNVRND
jgi:hypothetical protein